jgi:hypothetical protein
MVSLLVSRKFGRNYNFFKKKKLQAASLKHLITSNMLIQNIW